MSLKWRDYVLIVENARILQAGKSTSRDWDEVHSSIKSRLNIPSSSASCFNKLDSLRRKYGRYKKAKKDNQLSKKFPESTMNEVVLIADDFPEDLVVANLDACDNEEGMLEDQLEPPSKRRSSYKPLSELQSPNSWKARTDAVFSKIEELASKEGLETTFILGYLLTRCKGKKYKDIGKEIMQMKDDQRLTATVTSTNKISTKTALALYCDCNLGRMTFNNKRKV